MPRKNKKKKIQKQPNKQISLKKIIVFVVIAAVLFLLARGITVFFTTSRYFEIKNVKISESLRSIKSTIAKDLKGKNIFKVGLKSIENKLRRNYPQCANVRISRRFPNTVFVEARQRLVFAQVAALGESVAIDKEGTIIAIRKEFLNNLPVIKGVKVYQSEMIAGQDLKSRNLEVSLDIIKKFRSVEDLNPFSIYQIDVYNLSSIHMYISNNLKVILDSENIEKKIENLGLVLKGTRSEPDDINYIDLRFREPVVKRQ